MVDILITTVGGTHFLIKEFRRLRSVLQIISLAKITGYFYINSLCFRGDLFFVLINFGRKLKSD